MKLDKTWRKNQLENCYEKEIWMTVDELFLQPWYQEYLEGTSFASTLAEYDLTGEVQFIYKLYPDTYSGEYCVKLYGSYYDLEEEFVDFNHDPKRYKQFLECSPFIDKKQLDK